MSNAGAIMLIYQGPGSKRVVVRGPATNTVYRFRIGEPRYVDVADAQILLERKRAGGIADFVVHQAPVPAAPAVPVAPAAMLASPGLPWAGPAMPVTTATKDTGAFGPAEILAGTTVIKMKARIQGDVYTLSELQQLFATEAAGKKRKAMLALLSETIDKVTAKAG